MRRNNTPWHPVAAAALQWSEEGHPLSAQFDDVYYSRDNGLEESRHVFLQGNDLPQRWQDAPPANFCIAETGFGTGLNFLLAWQTWRTLPEPRPGLHYIAVEKYPLATADMARALAAWPALAPLAELLLGQYPGLVPGQHRLLLDAGRVILDLWWEDVADSLSDLAGRELPVVNAWYLDGFAPARNPAMWQSDVLQAIAALSRPGATFATFTAAGKVRRGLEAAGFEVHKTPGFGRKRECLQGKLVRSAQTLTDPATTPWDLPASPQAQPDSALVIGAGLAGCTVAAALARRGVAVTLLEAGQLAAAGSANDQGVLYTRLSAKHSPLTDFALLSFAFAARFYRSLFADGRLQEGLDGALCGSFHQCRNTAEMATLAAALDPVPQLASVLDAEAARAQIGLVQPHGGYWYPESGWLRPASVCRALLDAPGVRLLQGCGLLDIATGANSWQARDPAGAVIGEAPCLVVAAGPATTSLAPFDWLPLQAIRGQTTDLPTSPALASLRAALCHDGYIAPARAGVHCIGASFNLGDDSRDLRAADHEDNLAKLAGAVPAWREELEQLEVAALGGRVGFRCASPDYLPVVGPAPDVTAFLRTFAPLRKNARHPLDYKGNYMPGLYLSAAHGSRGLTSTPLAAEMLASQICGEAPPVARELGRALAPARFLIRDLARNRI